VANIYDEGKSAVAALAKTRQRGSYHAVRDPEGAVTLWSVQGEERGPFRITFANRGRISGNIEEMPPEFVKAFVEYVRRSFLKK